MLQRENNLLIAFNSLIKSAIAFIRTNLPQAIADIKEAKKVIRVLIAINRKEGRQL